MPVAISPYALASFDLDRTLIFHAKDAKQAEVVALLAEYGVPVTHARYQRATQVAREFYDVLGYLYADEAAGLRHQYVKLTLELLGCDSPEVIERVAAFYQAYDADDSNFFVPAEAIALLNRLGDSGVRIVAISSNLMAAQRVAHTSLAGVFEQVLSPTLGRSKAELFPHMLNSAGIDPSACIHVGDDPILDVLAPQRHGMAAILFDPNDRYAELAWPHRARTYTEIERFVLGDARA